MTPAGPESISKFFCPRRDHVNVILGRLLARWRLVRKFEELSSLLGSCQRKFHLHVSTTGTKESLIDFVFVVGRHDQNVAVGF